jgi:hypothetical protein
MGCCMLGVNVCIRSHLSRPSREPSLPLLSPLSLLWWCLSLSPSPSRSLSLSLSLSRPCLLPCDLYPDIVLREARPYSILLEHWVEQQQDSDLLLYPLFLSWSGRDVFGSPRGPI